VQAVAPGILHVRLFTGKPAQSLMERYGVVRSEWPAVQTKTRDDGERTILRTSEAELAINKKTGAMELRNSQGRVLCPEIQPLLADRLANDSALRSRTEQLIQQFSSEENPGAVTGSVSEEEVAASMAMKPGAGFGLLAKLQPGELFYGLGTSSKDHIQLRGGAYYNWVRYRFDEQPVPFIMSSAGWGLFVNTTWRHYFDVGKTNPNEMLVWGGQGDLDFYLLTGEGYPELLDRYTQISGRPMMLPQWSYGLTWANHILSDQFVVLDTARRFRDYGIPIDGMGLEPNWMKKFYDRTTKKQWNDDRFYMQDWNRGEGGRNQSFIGAVNRMGFKFHLWLVSNYDVSPEAERQYRAAHGDNSAHPGDPEPWFEHLKQFIDDGIVAWKMDPGDWVGEIDRHRVYANGRTEYEMHNINGTLGLKQMEEGQRAYTGQRAMQEHSGGYAGMQKWSAQTVGDILGGPDGAVWMLNSSLSGYSNVTGDIWVHRPASYKWCVCSNGDPNPYWPDGAGLHLGFLSGWSLLDGWAYLDQPWYAGPKIEPMIKMYAKLRYSLMPYIYSAAHKANESGMPIMRALPLKYPNDARLQDVVREYMFGDSLLVTVYTKKAIFPAGRWIDYWTGKEYQGPAEIDYEIPEGHGGGLFIKAGAIIPYWPEMDYVGEKPVGTLDLHVYPEGATHFTLAEDDGLSLAYETGAIARTEIESKANSDGLTLSIAPRAGSYDGMPATRRFNVFVHTVRPGQVQLNGVALSEGAQGWQYDSVAGTVRLQIAEDPARKTTQTVRIQRN
jgi:alpha-glucosidase (family GH31 glycosyl hydrolase)